MINVLLASELSWQRNDAIMFFTCLCKRELVPPLVASIMAKFEQIRFGNILKRSFKGHKNGE